MQPHRVFISHNKANKVEARLIASALVQQGIGVWFDEWNIAPGESITGGIEEGLANSDTLIIVWSADAEASKWVGTEIRSYIRRRVDDDSLRIIPIMLDDTELPVLRAEYKGFKVSDDLPINEIAENVLGIKPDNEIARLLQARLLELTDFGGVSIDPLPYMVCPDCGSTNMERREFIDEKRDDIYMIIHCKDCNWGDSTEI
jgi:hypothetical protein